MKPTRLMPSLTLSVALLAGCGKNSDDAAAKKPLPPVQAVSVKTGDLTKYITYTGSIEPVKTARMASPAEGPIVECPVREGDRVEAGQLLARVGRSRIAETGLTAAREELRRQESEFRRVEQLVQSGSLPGDQLDAARSNLRRAEAQVAAMETGTDDYEIRAPWNGLVSRVWISEGNYVSPRAPLVELYDPQSLVVRLTVPEQQVLSVQTETAVNVQLDAHPGKSFAAEITRIYPELDRITRTVTVEATLNEPVELLSGMFARVELPMQTVRDVAILPGSALIVRPNGETVIFLLEGRTVRQRTIHPVLEAGGQAAVRGMDPGSSVIVRGNESLQDGAEVMVMPAKEKTAK
jgi:membrane fusion protein, multidrug efflux system